MTFKNLALALTGLVGVVVLLLGLGWQGFTTPKPAPAAALPLIAARPLVPATQPAPTVAHPPIPSPSPQPARPVPQATPLPPAYYVATTGNDKSGDGSARRPWGTIGHALDHVPDGAVVLVQPGLYIGQVELRGTFAQGVIIRSEIPYQAQLRHDSVVVAGYEAQGITLEGFDIAHSGPDSDVYVIQIQDLRGEAGGTDTVSRIVLRNNILHDSYNNDIVKLNKGASQITLENNVFYNQAGLDSHIDINSVRDVIIQDNIFFNDFEGSNRPNRNDTGSYIVIKDSNAKKDTNLGARNIVVRRNVFLNWQGDSNNTFVVVGEDDVSYYQAQQVLIENNLFLGNSPHEIRAPLQLRGVRDVTYRHNTVVGDLPSKAFTVRLSRADKNPKNQDVFFYNNLWSDPTGTMGAGPGTNIPDFSDTDPDDTNSFVLRRNLYWNGAGVTPFDENELVNYTNDPARIISDPLLPPQQDVILPRWLPETGVFADGSDTIRAAFVRLVKLYGVPATGSVVIDAADPAYAPAEDILGQSRPAGLSPDLGAYEVWP